MKQFETSAWVAWVVAATLSQLFNLPVRAAALGDKEILTDADRSVSVTAASASHVRAAFTVKEIISNATPVREYLSRDGTVFGLAWKGRNHPDFSALLGSFYAEYQELNSRHESGPHVRGGHRNMQGAHLIVEKYGHMGSLKGRAFIPSLMPAGVKANEIK